MRKEFLIPAALCAALAITSCGGDNDGTSPQTAESSSSAAMSSSSATTAGSSSGGTSVASSSGTQINSSSSVSSSSGSGEACDEEGERESRYFPSSKQWIDYICTSGLWIVYVASSSSAASSSSYYDMDSLFSSIENLSYGEFTDPRDGQTYKTIKASSYEDYEYFAENLNYGKQISGSAEQTDSTKYCYNDDPWYCAHHFGGLYQWSTAMGFPPACNDVKAGSSSACPDSILLPEGYDGSEALRRAQRQGICPDGWHIMNEDEWSIVIGGGSPLKSQVLWRVHSNSKGLSVLPAGYRDSTGVYFYLGSEAYFWLPHEHSTDINRAYLVYLDDNIKDVVRNGDAWIRKTTGMSVRCVKDHE